MRNVIITTLGLLAFSSLANAQSRPMPLLEMPVSAEALSVGNTLKGSQQSHYIFTNPSSMMQQGSKMNISYGSELISSKSNTSSLHIIDGAIKHQKNAFFAGVRYWHIGSKDTFVGLTEHETNHKKITEIAFSVDLGYAYQWNKHLTSYVTTGYSHESGVTKQHAWQNNIGVTWNDSTHLIEKDFIYNIGISADHLGVISYRKVTKALSPRLSVGGSAHMMLTNAHQIELFADAGLYPSIQKRKSSTECSLGLGYALNNKIRVRMGRHLGDKDNYWTMGAGYTTPKFNIFAAAKLTPSSEQPNIYMLNLGFNIK